MAKVDLWMPLYVADFMADTSHLDAAEVGAYISLIMAYWRSGGPLKANERALQNISRMTADQWAQSRETLLAFFTEVDGFLTHKRIDSEIAKAKEFREEQARKGKASAEKRWGNKEDNRGYNRGYNRGITEPVTGAQPDCNPSPTPTPTPTPIQITTPSEEINIRPNKHSDDCRAAVAAWNDFASAHGLAQVARLTETRKTKLTRRLEECGGLDGWAYALAKIRESPFLLGETSNWKADFDFVLQASSFTKLMEGSYDRNANFREKSGNGFSALAEQA